MAAVTLPVPASGAAVREGRAGAVRTNGFGRAAAPAPVRVTTRCAGCGACLLTCPVHAIRPHGDPLLVLADLCTGCLECVEVCPVDAIEETFEVRSSVTTIGAAPGGPASRDGYSGGHAHAG